MPSYSDVEDAIKTALTTVSEGSDDSPIMRVDRVELSGGQLADNDLLTLVETMQQAEAGALVFYAGGESNEGFGQVLVEEAEFHVIVFVQGISRTDVSRNSSKGLYAIMDRCRDAVHGLRNDKCPNPLRWLGNARLGVPGRAATVASRIMRFKTQMQWPLVNY